MHTMYMIQPIIPEWGPTMLELWTTASLPEDGAPPSENYPTMNINLEEPGIWLLDQAKIPIPDWSLVKVFRKWTHYCFSFNFFANQAQVAMNGKVIATIENPKTTNDGYADQLGSPKIFLNNFTSKYFFVFGRYFFDGTKNYAKFAGFQVWNTTLSSDELKKLSSCEQITKKSKGSVDLILQVPESNMSKLVTFDSKDLLCTKYTKETLIPLPIPPVNKVDAINACAKLGKFSEVGGEFLNEADFEHFYNVTNKNRAYSKTCSEQDAGRLKTWLPYTINNMSEITNDNTGEELQLRYFTSFYVQRDCLGGYFGDMLPYKRNIYSEFCSSPCCVVCKVSTSLQQTAVIKLRGLCKFSLFDHTYQVTYENQELKYYGLKRSVIWYNSTALSWQVSDMIDPSVHATFESGFRSLGLGTHTWQVSGDLRCRKGSSLLPLSLTSCSVKEFTCHQGLCIPLEDRSPAPATCPGVTGCPTAWTRATSWSAGWWSSTPATAGAGTPP